MPRNLLLAAAAALAALALLALALLGGSGRPADAPPDAPERRAEPAVPEAGRAAALEAAPARVERDAEGDEQRAAGDAATGSAEDAWQLAVRVVTTDPAEPLTGWSVLLTEVGATGVTALASERRATLGTDGLGVFTDLPRRGPWFVHLADARPGGRGRGFLHERLGAASASTDAAAEAVRFEVERGPVVLLTSPLPAGVAPTDLLFRLRAAPSVLSSQIGGLGGVGRGQATPEASAAAMTPRITNSVRGEGAHVDIWSEDGGWWAHQRIDERVENDARITVDAHLEPAGRLRFRIAGTELGSSEMLIRAVESAVRQADPAGDPVPRARHTVEVGDGLFELHGLAPGPAWIDEGAEALGVRFAPLQAQASQTNPAEVTVEVLGLAGGPR